MRGGSIDRRPDGNWTWMAGGPRAVPRPCLFLDRDGVLIEERNYLADPAGVAPIPGAAEAILAARARGWAVAVVTNQAGVGRGYFSWDDFEAVQARLLDLLAPAGAAPDMVLACPYHVDGIAPFNRDDDWRKPRDGMLRAAAATLNLDLGRSVLVGDRLADLEAAESASLALGLHVMTGHGWRERERLWTGAPGRLRVVGLGSIAEVPAHLPDRAG